MASQAELIQLVRRKAQHFLGTNGVTSVGVGYYVDKQTGQETEELCIQYTVEKKVSTECLEEEGLTELPEHIVDEEGNEVRVQVIERRYKPHVDLFNENAAGYASFRGRRTRQDPIRPGISVAHEGITAGTLGAIVYDRQTGQPYILSNWHVLQGGRGNIGDRVLQPGPRDAGTRRRDTVGRVVRSHIGLAGDCAISSIEGRSFDRTVWDLNLVPKPKVGRAELDDQVIKSGRTTGVTRGIVKRVGVVYKISYSHIGEKRVGGFDIRPDPDYPADGDEISMGGDSGSVWMIAEGRNKGVVAGLHFAGETDPAPRAERAIACNIHSVIGKLDVTFRQP